MRFRHGLVLLAVLTATAGCASVEPTTQTSMLRGPTPSSGMSIPQLLQVPGGATDDPAAGTEDSVGAAPAGSDDPAATPTDQSAAPAADPAATDDPGSDPGGTDAAGTIAAGPDNPPTDVTDEFNPTGPDNPIVDPTEGDTATSGPDLEELAASFSCLDYAPTAPSPGQTAAGGCLLDEDQVLLYSFATDQAGADYASSLVATGATSDQLAQGPGYLIWADAASIGKIKSALGAG